MQRILIGAVLITLCAAVAAAPSPKSSKGFNQNLAMTNGTSVHAVFDRNIKSFKVPLADGTYFPARRSSDLLRVGLRAWAGCWQEARVVIWTRAACGTGIR